MPSTINLQKTNPASFQALAWRNRYPEGEGGWISLSSEWFDTVGSAWLDAVAQRPIAHIGTAVQRPSIATGRSKPDSLGCLNADNLDLAR